MDHRTHSGGLYCNEGSTHVSRPSIRVRQTPGGNSSWNFLSMNQDEENKPVKTTAVVKSPKKSLTKQEQEIVAKPLVPEKNTQQANAAPNNWNNALFCNEGSQVRGRPSVRVRQPCGGSSSWNFLSSN